MRKFFLVLLLLAGLSSCDSKTSNKSATPTSILPLEEDKNYPQWLTANRDNAQQTSGITFFSRDQKGGKHFLIADDIGKIHHLVISNELVQQISPVILSKQVMDFLSDYPKWDFEEISYDKYTGDVYLSIEGNGKLAKNFTTLLKLNFAGNSLFSDTVISAEKIPVTPDDLFRKYVSDNIGFEGVTSDENYIYLGLEGFAEDNLYEDHTIIFVVDKKDYKIIKEINTRDLEIQTICGLYSDKNNSLFGIDRNNKKVFHITLDKSLDVTDIEITKIQTDIPGYHLLTYVAALESITMDDEKNIYIVDDPWKKYFIPSEEVLKKLDNTTVKNFENFIPVIYKFNPIN